MNKFLNGAKKVEVGRFGKTHGVIGWLSVISFTEPQENIVNLMPWLINQQGKWQVVYVENSRVTGNKILVKLKGVSNCEQAREYTNISINVERDKLPSLPNKQYYWTDLEGLKVFDSLGKELGIIDHLLATGANDVLVIKQGDKELLVPYLKDVIIKVDLENQLVKVNYEF